MTTQESDTSTKSGQQASDSPQGAGEDSEEDIGDHTVTSNLYYSELLSNPNLTDALRQKIIQLQAEHTVQGKKTSSGLGIWLSRTPSRQELARRRRELEALQALDDATAAPPALVRTPSAAARHETAEIARLEQMGTHAEMARVQAEVERLKRELGLQVE